MVNKVIKRNDATQDFDLVKIVNAIRKANNAVEENQKMTEEQIEKVVATVEKSLEGFDSIPVEDIHSLVEKALMKYKFGQDVARAYILYREDKKKQKKFNTVEEKILTLVDGTSDLRGDNANKHIDLNSSMRDYFAGIPCKTIARKILPKDIIKAHDAGLIHWHDMDYSPIMPMHNCDLINVEEMVSERGTQMGDTKIHSPKIFSTLCNLLAQFSLIVSGSQYGGQTISWAHTLPFVQKTRDYFKVQILNEAKELGIEYTPKQLKKLVEMRTRDDIHKGIKTYQYQILCHHSSNGQTPFVSNNLCLREAVTKQELDDFAIIIEEILNRRIKGVKDSKDFDSTPLFPKLLYWTCDGLNVKEGDPYFYLTELAAKCMAIRCQPDICSEKKTREVKEGQIIPSMGCRSSLSPIWEEVEYPLDTKFYWVYNTDNKVDYPYGTFVNEASFEEVHEGKYKKGKYAINFRGNTGWLLERKENSVVILQPKVYGRFNEGVITVNLPHVAGEAVQVYNENSEMPLIETFYKILDERLELCRKGLQTRNEYVRKIKAKNSPILWMHGALYRNADPEKTVGELIDEHPARPSISLGYAGLYETCQFLIGQSNTSKDGIKLCKQILTYINKLLDKWKAEDHLNYSLYGTPEEQLTQKLANANRRDFGLIEHITDKDYVVNSYHVDPRETISAWDKLRIEGQYLDLSKGGAVSYVETNDLTKNPKVIVRIIQYMHDNISYAEVNTTMGVCYTCGNKGFFPLTKSENGVFKFHCPKCGENRDEFMSVKGRICGYLGELSAGNTGKGRLDDYFHRTPNLDFDILTGTHVN